MAIIKRYKNGKSVKIDINKPKIVPVEQPKKVVPKKTLKKAPPAIQRKVKPNRTPRKKGCGCGKKGR